MLHQVNLLRCWLKTRILALNRGTVTFAQRLVEKALVPPRPSLKMIFYLNSAIADQKMKPSRLSAELMAENSVSCDEVTAVDEGQGSAAPVTSTEKWSHEAIVALTKL
ncbi:hypothetical protein [Nostoc sp.]|uniref:hypothetical protein n=1 Tax=Nostoc sp. TaxID=1180 RepID=UPI002FF29ADC